nr:polysaccharide deacetylase family protein [Leucobacter ruminantium]
MFLGALFAASALSACAAPPSEADRLPKPKASPAPTTQPPVAEPTPVPTPEPPPPPQYVPAYDLPGGPIWGLPDEVGNQLAWTVDDGASPEVVMAYANFAQQTGTRLTFFINGMYADAWTPAAPVLAPMIATGQVQIANHTFSHPSLTSIGDAQIQDDLMRNHDFIQQLFGVDARPWYRPPYGNRDARTDAAAAAVGYTQPVMWYGSLGDSGLIPPEVMLQEAGKWLLPAHIVLGHANAPTVTGLFPQLTELLASRGLATVTLNDVFRTA